MNGANLNTFQMESSNTSTSGLLSTPEAVVCNSTVEETDYDGTSPGPDYDAAVETNCSITEKIENSDDTITGVENENSTEKVGSENCDDTTKMGMKDGNSATKKMESGGIIHNISQKVRKFWENFWS